VAVVPIVIPPNLTRANTKRSAEKESPLTTRTKLSGAQCRSFYGITT